MNSRASIMRGNTMKGSELSKRTSTNKVSMINQKKDNNNKRLLKFKKTFPTSAKRPIKRTTSLPNMSELRETDSAIKISKLAGSSTLKNFFRFTRRPRSRERKFWYRSWSSSPQKKSKTLYKRLPNFDYEVPEMPKKVIIYLGNLAAKGSYVGFTGVDVHLHNHRKTPHVHNPRMCGDIRTISGYDKNRQNRFYFTKNKTPVRVYFNYDGNLTNTGNILSQLGLGVTLTNNKRTTNDRITSSLARPPAQTLQSKKFSNIGEDEEDDPDRRSKVVKKKSDRILQLITGPVNLNGRKLSANSLKHTKISPHFMEEAKNLLYSHETMSFFPPVEVKEFTRNSLTLAEMAVLPLHYEEKNHLHHQNHHTSHSKVSAAHHAKESHAKESHAQVKNSVAKHQPKHSTLGSHESNRSVRPDTLNEISEDD